VATGEACVTYHDNGPTQAVAPLLRWAGSKRKILPTLSKYWDPKYTRYVEPFAGSAALFFSLQPGRAVLGDINRELMETYKVVRESPDDVYDAVVRIKRNATTYYALRSKDLATLSTFERAVRFIYLNRYCFNGIYRTNKAGRFNVPYANKKPGVIPSIEQFRRCANLLHRADLRAADFGNVLRTVRKNDFVYLDPPYAVQSRRIFRQYDERDFLQQDLRRLKEHLLNIQRKGAFFILSYADCKEIRSEFADWQMCRVRVRRNIAGFVSARRTATEVIVTNIDR
jgi:DNA adenine methylase